MIQRRSTILVFPITMVFLAMICSLYGCVTTGVTPENRKKADANRNLGEAYLSEGKHTAALRELFKAKELNPEDPITYNDLGLVYFRMNKVDEAITQFEKAIELRPDYSVAKNNLGGAYLQIKEWDKAIAVLSDVTGDMLYATPHYPLANLGWAYYNKGNYSKAQQYLKEALTLRPDFFFARLNLGRAYLATGQLNEARKTLEKAAEQSPQNPALLLEMGRTYRLLGDYRSATLALKGVIELSEEADLAIAASEELRKMRQ